MSKRIVISTGTPNDQGGVIPSNTLDFKTRFNKNPVCLKNHGWDDDPIGMWTDIRLENGEWSGIPVFHGLTEESAKTKALYDGGWIRAASIGGEAVWKVNAMGQLEYDGDGNRICERFIMYETSIVTLPSNPDAVTQEQVQLAARIYEQEELERISTSIVTLSSKFNSNKMSEQTTTTTTPAAEPAGNAAPAPGNGTGPDKTELSAGGDMPKWLEKILHLGFGIMKTGNAASVTPPAPEDLPVSKPGGKAVGTEQPTPVGLKAKAVEEAKSALEKANEKAQESVNKAAEAKKKAEGEDATEEMKAAYEKACQEADEALKACEAAEKEYEKAKKDADDEDAETMAAKGGKPVKTTNAAAVKPALKTRAELEAEMVKLAPAPKPSGNEPFVRGYAGPTFTQLRADKKGEGKKILDRVMYNADSRTLADYNVMLNALMSDPKYQPIMEVARFIQSGSEAQVKTMVSNPKTRKGSTVQHFASQLQSGNVEFLGRDGRMRSRTTLSSSDNALASPALNAIEFLSLVIFALFPDDSWKEDIPTFGADLGEKNTGFIWANIAANPTFTKGTAPSNASNYSYNDTAVSLALVPYYVPSTIWTPQLMHQYRYDQLGTGWAQIFAAWNAFIDDELLYSITSQVPASAIYQSSGLSGYNATPQVFSIAAGANDPNSFYWNSNFGGNLKAPVLNDIIGIEKIYARQNFDLETQKPILILDPTQKAFIMQDPETKTFLTRYIEEGNGMTALKIMNTKIKMRSRIAMYDTVSAQFKDPAGVMPTTAMSSAFGCIPSQVGLAFAMLDVFMVQSPQAYGYVMSADTRMGIAALRAALQGIVAYTYGPGAV